MAPPVFPASSLPGIGVPVKRAQSWGNPPRAEAVSGRRTRYSLYTYPIYSWELTIDFLRAAPSFAEWQALEGFIASVNGPAQLFAYSDPNDSSVTAQGFGTGDGASTAFQLVRSLGGFTIPVYLINGTPTIFVAGTPTAVTISPYGVVTFASPPAPGAALTWTGSYYFGCRFDEDVFAFSEMMTGYFGSGLWDMKSLKFSSEKLP